MQEWREQTCHSLQHRQSEAIPFDWSSSLILELSRPYTLLRSSCYNCHRWMLPWSSDYSAVRTGSTFFWELCGAGFYISRENSPESTGIWTVTSPGIPFFMWFSREVSSSHWMIVRSLNYINGPEYMLGLHHNSWVTEHQRCFSLSFI